MMSKQFRELPESEIGHEKHKDDERDAHFIAASMSIKAFMESGHHIPEGTCQFDENKSVFYVAFSDMGIFEIRITAVKIADKNEDN